MTPSDEKLGSSQRRAVLRELKQSHGLAVRELADRLGLSYMGVKQHCLALTKGGFIAGRNQHRGLGRPSMVYRLTKKGQAVFSSPFGGLCVSMLDQARTLFGPTAPGKILFLHFQKRTEALKEKILPGASPAERLARLAELRCEEGCMAEVDGDCLVEYHSPLAELFEAFPEALVMEESMLARASDLPLRRLVPTDPLRHEIRFGP
jgi:predicted ArsR family transcriptional regulator